MSSPGSAEPNRKGKKTIRGDAPPGAAVPDGVCEQARRENLEADTRLKNAQAQSLEDEHALLASTQRGQWLDNELKELKGGLILVALVVVLSLFTAEVTLAVAGPAHHPPGELLGRLGGMLLGW